MTETVKSLNYTKNILQTIPNNDTMEVVTQTNAVKSPTDSLKATTLVYTVEEIAQMLSISLRSAYNLCNSTTEFRVLRVGGSIRIPSSAGRRKHPHPERQFRCVAPGSLKKEITYGIYYETRQLLWCPLYLPRRAW